MRPNEILEDAWHLLDCIKQWIIGKCWNTYYCEFDIGLSWVLKLPQSLRMSIVYSLVMGSPGVLV